MKTIKNKTFPRDCNSNPLRPNPPSARIGDFALLDGSPIHHVDTRGYGPQLRRALNRVETLIVDGLQHGFFKYCITCEIVSGGKRDLVIQAGKSDKFTIPDDELPH
jgi:hypothetical protein